MRASLVAFLAVVSGVASAQWIHLPLPGTPRTKDGKPNLAAPAPRTADGKPDFSGVWVYHRAAPAPAVPQLDPTNTPRPVGGGLRGILQPGDEIAFQPWAEALYKQRVANNGVGLPSEHCLPHGPPGALMIPIPFKILQTPAEVAILFEEFNYYRQIFTDGRGHPDSMNPTWYGYSVGKWEKDALVVDTVGYNDRTWLDVSGYPHTEDMRTTERITRADFGHMEIRTTIDDPKAYRKPWTLVMHFDLQPDTELIEHVCDNERDAVHMVGK